MKKHKTYLTKHLLFALLCVWITNSCMKNEQLETEIYETSEGGNKLSRITQHKPPDIKAEISILPEEKYQTIIGFGGSFTEASASLLNRMGVENRLEILNAYFGESGAKYSLTRTHINSCDFSLGNYSYAPVAGDTTLKHFSVREDMDDLIPMIKDAMSVSKEGFKIISSPWTAPPWMKDNNDWRGGKLLPEYYGTWALFFSKYLDAYKAEGIDIFGVSVENEPLGNDNNWESMHYSPEEMNEFVKNHLGPLFKANGHQVKILGFDQNRDEELKIWADAMYDDVDAKAYYDGIAIHWYASTYDVFPEALQYVHRKAPDKLMIQTEACVDAEVPRWKDDKWYWSKEATDWGWDWAPEKDKHLHPKYIPAFRYARDIIGCMNNWVAGWIDWNMVLDRQGGPNWAENWCVAPVIVDPVNDEVYYTPLYYIMAHFSRFIRPGATRVGFQNSNKDLMVTAARNPDGTTSVVVFNPSSEETGIRLIAEGKATEFTISAKALQTIVITNISY